MKMVLAASDLTARSDRAVERAGRLATELDASLLVLHVIDDDLPEAIADRREQEALKALRAQLAGLPRGGRSSVKVAFGSAYESILREADDNAAELVVMGAHRRGFLRDLFVGSTADRTLRAGRAPVLVAAKHPAARYSKAVVAVDFSVHSRRAVQLAATLMPAGVLLLVHAYLMPRFMHGSGAASNASKREAQALRRQFVADMRAVLPETLPTGLQVETAVHVGDPTHVIRREVEQSGADLLVVGTHGRTGLPLAMLGSVAESLLADPPCDVAAVRAW